jgi:hypothetical protein
MTIWSNTFLHNLLNLIGHLFLTQIKVGIQWKGRILVIQMSQTPTVIKLNNKIWSKERKGEIIKYTKALKLQKIIVQKVSDRISRDKEEFESSNLWLHAVSAVTCRWVLSGQMGTAVNAAGIANTLVLRPQILPRLYFCTRTYDK